MTEQRCEVTELLVDQCACPDHRGGVEVVDELETVGPPFAAAHAGCCATCEGPIRPGELIARLAEQDDYVHAGSCLR